MQHFCPSGTAGDGGLSDATGRAETGRGTDPQAECYGRSCHPASLLRPRRGNRDAAEDRLLYGAVVAEAEAADNCAGIETAWTAIKAMGRASALSPFLTRKAI